MTADLAAVGGVPSTSARDLQRAAEHMAAVLEILGVVDVTQDGMERTPERFVKALDEMAWGRDLSPARHLDVTFPSEGGGRITVERIPVTALCAHHLLPFDGFLWVSYIPRRGARIVGLSKLARLSQEYAARATVQERITTEIADAVEKQLDVEGVAVLMKADHSCMSRRGARAHGADTITEEYRGVFDTDSSLQTGFLIKALHEVSRAMVEELG